MKNKTLARVMLAAGIILVVGALALTGYNLITDELAGQERDVILSELDVLIPAVPQKTEDNEGQTSEAVLPTFEEIKKQHAIRPDNELGEYEPQTPDETSGETTGGSTQRPASSYRTPTVTIDETEYIGKISMPAIKLKLPVIGSWSMDKLKVAPCLYYGSVYTEDMVLCAHNYRTHFGQIGRLTAGNRLTFTDVEGNEFAYRVAKVGRVAHDETEQLLSSKYELILFTCTLSGNKRIVIYCELISVNGTAVSELTQ